MKLAIIFCVFACALSSYAETATSPAGDVCLKSAKSWVIKSESKKTATKVDQIKNLEIKLQGNGANLYLVTMFVEGPKTGDNTHWEVVGEFNYDKNICRIILGRRYWAH
jgi:hypothetical protein